MFDTNFFVWNRELKPPGLGADVGHKRMVFKWRLNAQVRSVSTDA